MMPEQDFRRIITNLPRAMCEARIRSSHALISTGVTYPNGTAASVRIDEGKAAFIVSDDGYASHIAATMGATSALNRIAAGFAKRNGVAFEKGTFVLEGVSEETLAAAISVIANTSARAMERLVAALESPRLKQSRSVFDKRLQAAFGKKVRFNLQFRGATGREWEFDAGVEEAGTIVRLYELVSPSTQAVALANMKIADTRAVEEPPDVTAALVDYDATDPALRLILSNSGSSVIAANAEIAKYLAAA